MAIAAFWICRILSAGLSVDLKSLGLAEGLKLSTFASWNDQVRDIEAQTPHREQSPEEIKSRIRLAQAYAQRS